MSAPETVQVFTTGGTIDKEYFDAKSAYEIGEPQIGALLREADVAFPVEVEALMRKDSLDLTDADRRLIADRVLATPHRRVVVTHGTDTMAATARVVADALGPDGDTTVVFVGSLAPARFKSTDAAFNVGFAVAAAQTLPPGAYVAMNGRVFDPHHVRKDRERNRFEPVTPEA
ncbi:asparaginase domain-containing protein [Rubrivirga sp.]|uniref:asparaginase domain-containing protein n=1 Tax=Rubrivirga sp. TaxID=1885344 RepID=UPI003B51A74F